MSILSEKGEQMKQTFAQNLKDELAKKGKTQTDLVAFLGVSKGAVSQWCNGRSVPSAETALKIAEWLNIKLSDLTDEKTKPNAEIPSQVQVPLFASVSAGFGSTREEAIGTFPVTNGGKDVIAVLVSGDSMSPTIADGDTIIVKRQTSVDYGDIAVVRVDEEHFVKKVEYTPEYIRLVSLNEKYKPMVLTGKDMLRCSVEGKVIGSYKRW